MENPHSVHKNAPPQVATAGEALIDLIRHADGRFEACIGGAVYNLSRALARQGVATLYLNPLSADRFGRQLAAGLHTDGVQLARPEPVQEVTALAVVGVGEHGHPDYAFYREGVADRATSAAQLNQACADAGSLQLVCTGALALAPADAATYLPWLSAQRRAGKVVVVDANLRPSVMPDLALYRSHVLAALQYACAIKVSDEDLQHLDLPGSTPLAQAQHLLHTSNARLVALTRGGAGASLLTRHGEVFHARETRTLAVVDTVGAGDCFLAGLVVALLQAALPADWGTAAVAPEQAKHLLQHAIASASLCVQRRGCAPPLPAEVHQHLAAGTVAFQVGSATP